MAVGGIFIFFWQVWGKPSPIPFNALLCKKSNLQMHQKHQMHYMELIIKKVNSQDKEKIWHIFSITDAEEVLANPLVMTQVSGPIFVQCRRKREEKGWTTGRSEGYFLVYEKCFGHDQWQLKKIVKNIGNRSERWNLKLLTVLQKAADVSAVCLIISHCHILTLKTFFIWTFDIRHCDI